MSQMSFTGRMNATALSPLTGGLLSSNAGGYLSRNVTGTGYSAIEVTGSTDSLVAIHVTDEDVQFEEVPKLKDATTSEVTEYMEKTHGLSDEHITCIGPAGERQVRFASLMTYGSRAFGRGGLGAVLGAKGVKAISFDGDKNTTLSLPEDVQMDVHREAATADDLMKRQGTTGGTEFINEEFSLPTRYFSEDSFEHAASIGGNAVEKKKYKKASCSTCAYACKLPTRDENARVETEGPEFETVYAFGSSQGIGELVDVMKSNELCDQFGMDTISCGITIAAYLKAHNEFGNADLVHELVEKIAFREGEGDQLAEGVDRIHDQLGVENFTVKGMEFAAHDGRVLHGQGLSYAVANRGGDHMYSTMLRLEYDGEIPAEGLEEKTAILKTREDHAALRDSGIVCAFAGGGGYVTGCTLELLFDADYEKDLLEVGSKVIDLERHFNNKRGMDRTSDRLPYDLPGFESALEEYYTLRGWKNNGTVPDEQVRLS